LPRAPRHSTATVAADVDAPPPAATTAISTSVADAMATTMATTPAAPTAPAAASTTALATPALQTTVTSVATASRRKCIYCASAPLRLDLHLTRVHAYKSTSAEYKSAMSSQPSTTTSDDVPSAITATLEGLLNDFHSSMQGLAGGSTESRPATQKRNCVSRILYAILGVDEWSPSVLRRLKTVGEKPHGVLYRFIEDGKMASTVSSYVVSLLAFLKYMKAKPELLVGFCRPEELPAYMAYLSLIQKSASRLRAKQDTYKKTLSNDDHCALFAQIGGYNSSMTVKRIFSDLTRSMATQAHITDKRLFVKVRDCVMLCAELWNARRAGDFCNIKLSEWANAQTNAADPNDHIVYVR